MTTNTFDSKDLMRIEDMATKAAGDRAKMVRLARQMANSIKDVDKALRRAFAAESENYHDVAEIFFGRFQELR